MDLRPIHTSQCRKLMYIVDLWILQRTFQLYAGTAQILLLYYTLNLTFHDLFCKWFVPIPF